MRVPRWGGAFLVAVLAACSNSAPPPAASPRPSDQPLRVRLSAPVRTTDPALASSPSDLAVLTQIGEPLLKPAPDQSDVVPAAAGSYDVSPDGLTYTFHLRAASYGDGTPVKAADFVTAWRHILDPRTASPYADLFASVIRGGQNAEALDPKLEVPQIEAALAGLGLKALDDATLQVQLPGPEGWAKWIFALPQAVPIHAGQAPSNGPFTLKSSDAGGAALDPNPGYWAGPSKLAGIRFQVVAQDDAAVAAYNEGRLDVAPIGQADPGLAKRLVRQPQPTVFWIDLNTSQPPFDNQAVRQAFAAALDRQALVRDVLHQRAAPAGGPVPAGLQGAPASGQDFDAKRAKALLAGAGVPAGQLDGLKLTVADRPQDHAIASFVSGQLKQNLGLDVGVEAVRPEDFLKRLGSGDFKLAGPEGWTADYADGQDFLELFTGSDGRNHPRWRNAAYDLLVQEAAGERDQARRDHLEGQAGQLLVEQAPAVFLFQPSAWALVKPYVRGGGETELDAWPGSASSSQLYLAGR